MLLRSYLVCEEMSVLGHVLESLYNVVIFESVQMVKDPRRSVYFPEGCFQALINLPAASHQHLLRVWFLQRFQVSILQIVPGYLLQNLSPLKKTWAFTMLVPR